MTSNLVALAGMALLIAIAVLISTDRRAISLRVVGAAFGLQALTALIVLFWTPGRAALAWFSTVVMTVIGYSKDGIDLVFGGLASDSVGFSFFVNALPIVIFFSSLMAVLYHVGIMQRVVWLIGSAIRIVTGVRAIESMNAAANIFVGQTEAPLVVRPYLSTLGERQLFAVMVSGMTSTAGTMIAAYVFLGADVNYVLAAAFMSAPGSLLMAKLIMPDAQLSEEDTVPEITTERHENIFMAAAMGASEGVKLAINIGAMLIAFVSLIALANGILGLIGGLAGWESLTLQQILGAVFAPLMFLLGIPWGEAQGAGALFGEKLVLNEFIAFSDMSQYLANASERTKAIVTFSLCGFANFGSIAILLGGLGTLIPERRDLIARSGLRALAGASLANLMSAGLAGLLL